MAGPWEKYGNRGVVASTPGAGPKPATGLRANPDGSQSYIPGSNEDPVIIRRNAAIQAAVQAEKDKQLAAYRNSLELGADATKRGRERAAPLDRQKLANIRAAQGQLDRIRHLYNKGPGRTKGLAGVFDLLPSSENAQFDTAGAGLGEVGLAAFRVPGVGAQSDTELRAFIDANRPSARDFDSRITEKVGNLQNRLDQTYQAYGMKRPPAKKNTDEPRVIDFNSLPD